MTGFAKWMVSLWAVMDYVFTLILPLIIWAPVYLVIGLIITYPKERKP